MSRPLNLGGSHLCITAKGADEALEKVNSLIQKLQEANELIEELASKKVDIRFGEEGQKLISD